MAKGDLASCVPVSCPLGSGCLNVAPIGVGPTYGLRLSRLLMRQPLTVAGMGLQAILDSGFIVAPPACEVVGNGPMSWLLAFDLRAGQLVTGVARPQAPPLTDIAFHLIDSEILDASGARFAIRPLVLSPLSLGAADTFAAGGHPQDSLSLPIFLNTSGRAYAVLPLRRLHISGKISKDHACIGFFQSAPGPDGTCAEGAAAFQPDGTITALLPLAEADSIVISASNKSVCALVTGQGDGAQPERCPRAQDGALLPAGDRCAATGEPAGPACHDAVYLHAEFSAAAVYLRD